MEALDPRSVLMEPGHINNLYNTTFWALVQKGGMGATEVEAELKVCSRMCHLWIGFSNPVIGYTCGW